jgi:hypothetical protein
MACLGLAYSAQPATFSARVRRVAPHPLPIGQLTVTAQGRTTLVSFDIDGTLEMGDPPGPLSADFVRQTQQGGFLIGSCSDRTIREQSAMWDAADIVPDFVVVKNRLDSVRERFVSDRYIHIGDTHVDAHFAGLANFEFMFVLDFARRLAAPGDPFADLG